MQHLVTPEIPNLISSFMLNREGGFLVTRRLLGRREDVRRSEQDQLELESRDRALDWL